MRHKRIILSLMILILIPLLGGGAHAATGHITLLTVADVDDRTVGGTADLFLEIRPGSGRVFIDSFPLTRLDTQISTRFAKDVACDFLSMDCSDKDFYYTIRADSSIVGGPSAGAAMAALTVALLDGQRVRSDVALTGTINSGGLIGPVAGVPEKTLAAERRGFSIVIIPKWSLSNQTNLTVSSIDVVSVSMLDEALLILTGKDYSREAGPISIPEEYKQMMNVVATDLCERYDALEEELPEETLNDSDRNRTRELRNSAYSSFAASDYYSAASFCFSATVILRTAETDLMTEQQKEALATETESQARELLSQIQARDLHTVSDLETSIIVKERLFETIDLLEDEDVRMERIGYIVERFNSAISWSVFFDHPGETLNIDENHLRRACVQKIAEAEERINYAELLIGERGEAREDLAEARTLFSQEDYAFCLFRAARVKADVNALVSSLNIPLDRIEEFVDDKLFAARIQINRQDKSFPILGYSYYDYANSLRNEGSRLSVVFSEYALELSNLEMYFPRAQQSSWILPKRLIPVDARPYFFAGFFMGMSLILALVTIIMKLHKKKRKPKRKRKSY